MIDRLALQQELNEARRIREAAEEANDDVEQLIQELQHARFGCRRVLFSVAGLEQEAA